MKVDKRTFIIVAVIVAIALPIIVFVFRKSFFPIILSMKDSFSAAAIMNGTTGIPPVIRNVFK